LLLRSSRIFVSSADDEATSEVWLIDPFRQSPGGEGTTFVIDGWGLFLPRGDRGKLFIRLGVLLPKRRKSLPLRQLQHSLH